MPIIRQAALTAALILSAACQVSLDAPAGVTITCAAGGHCPSGLVCVQEVNACVEPGTSCVEQRDGGFFPAADGNVCTRDGAPGVCRSGACIRCGDGVIDEGETCDDRNLDSTDSCPLNCLVASCGDGYVHTGVEECDDGNTANEDGCLTSCVANTCGDGFVDASVEGCDDQNDNENDGCSHCAATVWSPSIATGLGPGNAAPLTTPLVNLGPIATTRSGLLYVGWAQVTHPANSIVPTDTTIGGIFKASAIANVVLPETRKGGTASHGDELPEVGRAREIQLGLVKGMVADARGNLFFTMINSTYQTPPGDYVQYGAYVLRLELDGSLHIVAGDEVRCVLGVDGTCGNGGRARDASFSDLGGVVFDRRGRLHIVDGTAVRYIDVDGNMRLRSGAVPCADPALCGDPGPAIAAHFVGPLALTVDAADNIYIADRGAARVRRIDTDDNIATVIGTGIACTAWPDCNGGLQLGGPKALAADLGHLYIVDSSDQPGEVVRRASPGQATTQIVFGTGAKCDAQPCGDDGQATAATTDFLNGVAVIADDRIAVTEVENKLTVVDDRRPARVRLVDVASNHVTGLVGLVGDTPAVAGNLPTSHDGGGPVAWSPAGDLLFADDVHVYMLDHTTGHVALIAGADACDIMGGKCNVTIGLATTFHFSKIVDLASSTTAVYVADADRTQVFEVSGGTVRLVFGSAQRCLIPNGACPDEADARDTQVKGVGGIDVAGTHLYVTDPVSSTVWDAVIDGGSTRLAGTGAEGSSGNGGPAVDATMRCPSDVLKASDGGIYISDTDNCRVRVVNGGTITEAIQTIPTCINPASIGLATCGRWTGAVAYLAPRDLGEDATGLVVGGFGSASRRSASTLTRVAGSLSPVFPITLDEGGLATDAALDNVRTAARSGYPVAVASALGDTAAVRRLAADGTFHVLIANIDGAVTGGFPVAELVSPVAAARLSDTSVLLVDTAIGFVRRVDTAQREISPAVFARFGFVGSAIDPTPARFTAPLATNVDSVAVNATAKVVYLAEARSGKFFTVTTPDVNDATTWTIVESGDLQDAPTSNLVPAAMAYDLVHATLYVSDAQRHAVYALTSPTAVATPFAGTPPFVGFLGEGVLATNALLDTPQGLAVSASGSVYIADTGNNRVRRVGPDGRITTVLGTGVASSEGDGGPARLLPVSGPSALAFDQYGNLLVSAGPVLRVVYADDSGEPTGLSLGGTLYDAGAVPTQRDVVRCLTAAFSGNDGEIYVADACSGAVVLLRRL